MKAGAAACAAIAFALAAAAGAQGRRQSLRRIEPGWVLAGSTARLHLYGQDLAPREIRFDRPGIAARVLGTTPLAPANDEERQRGNMRVEVEVVVPADVPPGWYRFTLQGEGVAAESGTLCVDTPAPEVPEQEPNDSLARPQPLPAGSVTVIGKLDNEGVDVFRIEGKAGEIWRFEVFARRLSPPSKLEAVLRLRDARRTSLRAAVDQGRDCFIECRLPEDGPYLLELFDGDGGAGPELTYRLAIRRLSPASSGPAARTAP